MKKSNKFSPEVRERAVRMVQEHRGGYRRYAAQQRDPDKRCDMAKRDEVLAPQIEQVWQANMQVYGTDKVVRTTISDSMAPCPLDRVNRQFKADRPNQLRVSNFTYVSTWQGWLYVAFVIDV